MTKWLFISLISVSLYAMHDQRIPVTQWDSKACDAILDLNVCQFKEALKHIPDICRRNDLVRIIILIRPDENLPLLKVLSKTGINLNAKCNGESLISFVAAYGTIEQMKVLQKYQPAVEDRECQAKSKPKLLKRLDLYRVIKKAPSNLSFPGN